MSNLKILITGASGFLGQKIIEKLNAQTILGIFNSHRPDLIRNGLEFIHYDLTQINKDLESQILSFSPEVIIHTAAHTNVDECERNPELAIKLNLEITKYVVEIAKQTKAHLIHISTDQIFDGSDNIYSESSLPSPINSYGRTKLAAEKFIEENYPFHTILRTNFYGLEPQKKSFLSWLESTIQNNIKCTFFSNIYYTPIFVSDLIEMINLIIANKTTGTFNATGSEVVSKAEFALKVIDIINPQFKNYEISEFQNNSNRAQRPLNMSLSNKKITECLNYYPKDIETSLKKIFKF